MEGLTPSSLQMPEEQAFCLLSCVMDSYGMRDMMKSDFDGLLWSIFQTHDQFTHITYEK